MRYALRVRRLDLRALALPCRREVAVEGAGSGDRDHGEAGSDDLDRAVTFEPAQRRVERSVRDAPQRSERLTETLAQLVAVERLFLQESEDGQVEHDRCFR